MTYVYYIVRITFKMRFISNNNTNIIFNKAFYTTYNKFHILSFALL